jgi:DNA-directed RNA polymerase specialized sigma24 family protein
MRELSELVEAAQAGDSEAYGALIQRFQQMAYATAYTYLGDHHLAEDLVQEAALEAFVHLPQLKESAAFPGWFRQIVFRQCIFSRYRCYFLLLLLVFQAPRLGKLLLLENGSQC